jgi:7-cyano-7-deazaguanine synthase
VRKGMELGAPLERTWSCYQSEDEACGVCDSCVLRLRAFARAGVADPIPYRARSDSDSTDGPVSVKTSGRVAP